MALHAFEYSGQVTAIHGGLLARDAGRKIMPGYLAALRDARLYVVYLDDIEAPLEIEARWLMGSGGSLIYRSWVRAEGRVLAKGRIIIMTRPDTGP
jgi:predicted hotdog family 3-hydroxylacyl-ACP dehydratase